MALATVDRAGRPTVRYVLLKGVDERGFAFFTDRRSRKGRDLDARPRAAVAFYWDTIAIQVRIEGRVVRIPPPEVDAYWATRPRDSRIAASVSTQSAPIGSHVLLL